MESNKADKPTILFAAGGTGGHLFPAIAVADYLKENKLAHPVFIGTERMESELVPKLGYEFHQMPLTSPPRGLGGVLPWLYKLTRSLSISRKLIKETNARAVVCVGAYIGLPPGLAAAFTGTPLFLMESNVNLGKANLKLCSYAKCVITAYPETAGYLPKGHQHKALMLGNPLRSGFNSNLDSKEARRSFGLSEDKKTLLVMGGSLGALSINKAMDAAVDGLAEKGWQVIWQTGKNYEINRELPVSIKATKFIDDMPSAYAAADLVVCRSGATTCSELKLMSKPAILVPLPTAGSGEQKLNAQSLEKQGMAVMIEDNRIAADLSSTIERLMDDDEKRSEMAQCAGSYSTDIAAEIANHILKGDEKKD